MGHWTYRRGWVALLLFTVVIINYIDRIALSVASKSISTEFGFSPIQMGYLLSAFLWTYVLCLIPFGVLSEKVGAKALVGGGITVWSAATAMTAATTGFASILGARLVMGASEATTFPACGRVIRDWFPEKERGMITTLFNSGSSAGPAVGAIVAAALVSSFGWRVAFIILGIVGFLWFVVWQSFFGEPRQVAWLTAAETRTILMGCGDRSPGADDAPPSALGRLLSQPSVWGLMITQACLVYTAYLFLAWLPMYLQSTRQLTTMGTGYLTALPYIATLIFSILIARVSDLTLSSSAIQSGSRRYFIAAMALISMAILFAPITKRLSHLLIVLVLVLTGSTTGAGLNFTLASDLLRNPRDVSRVIAFTALGGNLFGLLAPILTGYIIAATGSYVWAFRVAATLLFCGVLASLFMTRRPISSEASPPCSTPQIIRTSLRARDYR